MTGFNTFNDSTSKRVLNLLEASYLRLREAVVITVITHTPRHFNDSVYSNYITEQTVLLWTLGNTAQSKSKRFTLASSIAFFAESEQKRLLLLPVTSPHADSVYNYTTTTANVSPVTAIFEIKQIKLRFPLSFFLYLFPGLWSRSRRLGLETVSRRS